MRTDVIDPYDRTYAHSQESVKVGQTLLHMLKERVSYESFYSKGMEKVSQNELPETGTLGTATQELRNHWANKSDQARILAEDLTGDLVEPLQSFLVKQAALWKKAAAEGKTLSGEAKQAKHTHDIAYQRYRRTCFELDQVMSRLESRSANPDTRFEDLSRLITLKKDCWESAKLYKSSLDQYHSVKQRYDSRMVVSTQPLLMSYFEGLERSRRDTVKDLLRKLVVYETAWLRNLQYETEKMAEVMEKIDANRDLSVLFPDRPVALPPLQYRQWKSEDSKSPVGEESQGLLSRLRKVTGRLFSHTGEERPGQFIEKQIEKAWRGESGKLDEEFMLHSALRDRVGRETWVENCAKRGKAGTEVAPEGVERLGEQLKVVLHECEKHKETDLPLELLSLVPKSSRSYSALQSLILAQAIYRKPWLWQRAADSLPATSHFSLQSSMETIGLDPSFIQSALGRYMRKPSLSVSEYRKGEAASRGVPKWVEDLNTRTPTRPSLSISQALPSLHTEEEDDDAEPEMSTEQFARVEIVKEEYSKKSTGRMEDETYDPSKHPAHTAPINLSELPSHTTPESLLRSFFRPSAPETPHSLCNAFASFDAPEEQEADSPEEDGREQALSGASWRTEESQS